MMDVSDPMQPMPDGVLVTKLDSIDGMRLDGDRLHVFREHRGETYSVEDRVKYLRPIRSRIEISKLACTGIMCLISGESDAEPLQMYRHGIFLRSLEALASVRSVSVAGSLALIGLGEAGVQLIDVSDPRAPLPLDTNPDLAHVKFVANTESSGFVASENRLHVFDISGHRLDILTDLTFEEPIREIAVFAHYCAIAVGSKVLVYDVSDAESPLQFSEIAGYAEDLSIDEQGLYITSRGPANLRFFELRGVSKPVELASWSPMIWYVPQVGTAIESSLYPVCGEANLCRLQRHGHRPSHLVDRA